VSTRDTRPGSTGGADVPEHLYGGPDDDYTAEQLAAMDREQLDSLGARYDGVEILHVDPGPAPGSTLEKRALRQVGTVFTLAGVFAFLFVVVYVGSGWFLPDWHWQVTEGGWSAIFTPLLGLCMGLAMGLVGVGLVLFTKKLLPHETAVQDKHDGSHFDRVTTGATLVGGLHNSGLARRKLITRSLAFMGGGLGLMLLMPLGGLIKNPNKGNPLGTTEWAKGVRLVNALAPAALELRGDSARLHQVASNLLGNAIKFTRERDPAVIEIGRRAGEGPVFFVKDNGVGFDMRESGQLFGVFQRLASARDYEGTGVGLAIVQNVVERHGGRVWAEASVGDGATFFFTLRAA